VSSGISGGGGTTGVVSSSSAKGRATFVVHWPARDSSRLIPIASNSIVIQLTPAAATNTAVSTLPSFSQTVSRPTTGNTTTTVFPTVPPGDYIATASAYPNADGTGVPQATGTSVPIEIVSGDNAPINLTMDSTVVSLEAPSITVAPGGSAQINVTALDSAGSIVLTSPSTYQFVPVNPNIVTVNASGVVTAAATANGDTTAIEVTETESGKSTSVAVTVGTSGGTTTGTTVNAQTISLQTNDIILDPATGMLYASVPSTGGSDGNSVVLINPTTLAVGAPTSVGSEPGVLAISGDGRYLYTGLAGAPNVIRVDLTGGTSNLTIALGSDSFSGPKYARDIEVQPGSPITIAVSTKFLDSDPSYAGVTMYDNAVARTNSLPDWIHSDGTANDWITFNANGSELYGFDSEVSSFDFNRIVVSSNGLALQDSTDDLAQSFAINKIQYSGGLVYTSVGTVINPSTLSVVGTFAIGATNDSGTLMYVSPNASSAMFLVPGSGSVQIITFNTATFVPTSTITVPNVTGTPTSFTGWGTSGAAFGTSGGEVYIVPNAT
jgi:hypothetical protein